MPIKYPPFSDLCMKSRSWNLVETLGFYEADDFVKTRWKIFSFIFDSFWPTSDDTPPVRLWCLIFAVRGPPSTTMIKRQSQ